jgi:hypothetical protein
MCGSIPDIVHANAFDLPPQRRYPIVQLSSNAIARGYKSPGTTHTQQSTLDDANADTTVVSYFSRQENKVILS